MRAGGYRGFVIATEAGEPLVRYRVEQDVMQLSAAMEIEARARDIEEIPWIAMLGWYVTAQLHRDSALRGVAIGRDRERW